MRSIGERLWPASLGLAAAAVVTLPLVLVLAAAYGPRSRVWTLQNAVGYWPILGEVRGPTTQGGLRSNEPAVFHGGRITFRGAWADAPPGEERLLVEPVEPSWDRTLPWMAFPMSSEDYAEASAISLHALEGQHALVIWAMDPRGTPVALRAWGFEYFGEGASRERLASAPASAAWLGLGAMSVLVCGLVGLLRARPWFKKSGMSSWDEGIADDGLIVPASGGESIPAPEIMEGPIVYRAERGTGGAYRTRWTVLESAAGTRASLVSKYRGMLRRAAAAIVAALVALWIAAALAWSPPNAPRVRTHGAGRTASDSHAFGQSAPPLGRSTPRG